MVKVAITATDPKDSSNRIWGLAIDSPPEGNWTKNAMIYQAVKQSGQLWNFDLPLSDGKHTLYFIVSAPNGKALYDGEALFDEAGFTFDNVDNDSIAPFNINVVKGKASKATGFGTITSPLENPGTKSFDGVGRFLKSGASKLKGLSTMNRDTAVKVGGAVAAVVVLVIISILGLKWAKKKNGFGRRR
jgi:hypothetical protein